MFPPGLKVIQSSQNGNIDSLTHKVQTVWAALARWVSVIGELGNSWSSKNRLTGESHLCQSQHRLVLCVYLCKSLCKREKFPLCAFSVLVFACFIGLEAGENLLILRIRLLLLMNLLHLHWAEPAGSCMVTRSGPDERTGRPSPGTAWALHFQSWTPSISSGSLRHEHSPAAAKVIANANLQHISPQNLPQAFGRPGRSFFSSQILKHIKRRCCTWWSIMCERSLKQLWSRFIEEWDTVQMESLNKSTSWMNKSVLIVDVAKVMFFY